MPRGSHNRCLWQALCTSAYNPCPDASQTSEKKQLKHNSHDHGITFFQRFTKAVRIELKPGATSSQMSFRHVSCPRSRAEKFAWCGFDHPSIFFVQATTV
eukprot:5272338-Amphidinium_carterae.2